MKRSHISILVAAGIFVCGAAYLRIRSFVDPEPPARPNTRVLLATLRTAINLHEVDTGHLPLTLSALLEKPADVVQWQGPYVKSAAFEDAWGTRIRYTPTESNLFELASAGPDAIFGTEDDITDGTPVRKGRAVNWGGGM